MDRGTTTRITDEAINIAYDKFCMAHGKIGTDTYYLFWRFLDCESYSYYLSDKGIRNFRALVSGHGYSIARAFIAQQGK